MDWTKNTFCQDCIHADGCLRECKLAEIYKQGYREAVERACEQYCRDCGCRVPECEQDCIDVTEFRKALVC